MRAFLVIALLAAAALAAPSDAVDAAAAAAVVDADAPGAPSWVKGFKESMKKRIETVVKKIDTEADKLKEKLKVRALCCVLGAPPVLRRGGARARAREQEPVARPAPLRPRHSARPSSARAVHGR